jgi:hypothetical protein
MERRTAKEGMSAAGKEERDWRMMLTVLEKVAGETKTKP